MLPHRLISRAQNPSALEKKYANDFKYRWGLSTRYVRDYLDQQPTTGLLICKNNRVLVEEYRFGRTDAMRLTSWSMAKSITSLLLGICLDRKLIKSLDETAATYAPELAGTLHGGVTLRNLLNMSSGANVNHQEDFNTIYILGLQDKASSIRRLVGSWNQRREGQGSSFNYNELCPLTLGIVIRKVTGMSMSEFAANALWGPIGSESDATWSTDSEQNEFNCIGFAAVLRDWGRVGLMIANKGKAGDVQVVSESWIHECTTWSPLDVKFHSALRNRNYKALIWHWKNDGSRPYFSGHHSQRVFIDIPSGVVLVHTAVDHIGGNWEQELNAMVDSAALI
jgi:CubicO group peptidase (beta-lactamase class C family)